MMPSYETITNVSLCYLCISSRH